MRATLFEMNNSFERGNDTTVCAGCKSIRKKEQYKKVFTLFSDKQWK